MLSLSLPLSLVVAGPEKQRRADDASAVMHRQRDTDRQGEGQRESEIAATKREESRTRTRKRTEISGTALNARYAHIPHAMVCHTMLSYAMLHCVTWLRLT